MRSSPASHPRLRQGDTHTLLPVPPPRPRLRQGIPGYLAGTPAPAAPSAGDTRIPRRHPRPGRASVGRCPCTSAGLPRPGRASVEIPVHPLPATPAPPAPAAGGIPIRFCRYPHPARAFGAPPPPPPRGRGQCVAISGEQPCPGCSRWKAVFGSSPGSPHAVDRVDIATGGEADGEGELVPPPLSPTLQPSYFSPASLARAFLPVKHTLSAGSPAPPAPSQKDTTRFCRPPPPAPISLPGRQGDIR